ncbi:hypothetical protein [Escherichia coli]|uniref:hypothetical protein n=1 Tax=Escherichia coli TaxID=562 RepID=UPI000CFC3197|nr:hypothetical protein [Escherichia coli]
MKFILATRNRYLECGLQVLLKGSRIHFARDFFMPANRRSVLHGEESWVIICDASLGRLMHCMFQGRHFLQMDVEKVKGLQDIHDVVRNGLWTWNTTVRALTMSEMVVMFGYVYRELKPLQLAKEMGIHTKTVNTFLYTGLAKNGMQSLNVRHLVCGVT